MVPTVNDPNEYKFDKFTSANGSSNIFDTTSLKVLRVIQSDTILANFVKVTTSIGELPNNANSFLASAYPTIFTDEVNLIYDLPIESTINASLYDNNGQKIATILSGKDILQQGHYISNLKFNNYYLANGIYYLKIQTKNEFKTIKLIRQSNN